MLGHIGLNVDDLGAAVAYYDELMALVGFVPFLRADDQAAYRPAGGRPGTYLFLYPAADAGPAPYSRHRTGLQHLAFMVPTRSAVDAVHEWAVARDAEILHPPRPFPEYPPPYYATFWLDPWGFMLEAVCHKDRA